MKVSITYLYTIYKYGYPPQIADDFKALADINRMGFHYLEMESLGPEHGEHVWEHRQDLSECLEDNGICVHNFCGVDEDLVSLDAKARHEALERFGRTAELGAYLGAETLHLASYAPPLDYVGKTPYALGESYEFADGFCARVPEGFSWTKVWDVLVESCQGAADIALQHGRSIVMEPRVGEVICSVDSMIRLIADVDRKNFRANFDAAHFCAQRENVPLALMKLEDQYANIHIADNDCATADHLPLGDGIIDWEEFFGILKRQGYEGYLGLDLGGSDTMEQDLLKSLAYINNIANQLGIEIEH